MRIAVVGGGRTGLACARLLGEDPRQLVTVFETGERFADAAQAGELDRLGVALRSGAQVERIAAGGAAVHVWVHGLAERFDALVVATGPAAAQALVLRSGLRHGSPGHRVVFTVADDPDPARAAVARLAASFPGEGPLYLPPAEPPRPLAGALQALARRTVAPVECSDLSGMRWPLDTPAVFVAGEARLLELPRRLGLVGSDPVRPRDTRHAVQALRAGASVGFVVAGGEGRVAAAAALAVNAPIVPLAARADTRRRPHVVIGRVFYPETSSITELAGNLRRVVHHLEDLADSSPPDLRCARHG